MAELRFGRFTFCLNMGHSETRITSNGIKFSNKCFVSWLIILNRPSSFSFISLESKELSNLLRAKRSPLCVIYTSRWRITSQLLVHGIKLSLCDLFKIGTTILVIPSTREFGILKLLWDSTKDTF